MGCGVSLKKLEERKKRKKRDELKGLKKIERLKRAKLSKRPKQGKKQSELNKEVVIYEVQDPITSNIHDFLQWAKDIGVMKPKYYREDIEIYADFFVAYQSYLNLRQKKDTVKERKKWFIKNRDKLIEIKLIKSGLCY
jgi:hypothetical protein